ncbi:MAG: MFS transporter [Oscillospiraceae bacterium]|jgi:GPH family glycoside/pentoside/hexuronide:cation symporter/probable glucitol transport protein GutA|nr:MFS transporter [Oscillospiraceae bacterium]
MAKLKERLSRPLVPTETAGEKYLNWREAISYALGKGAQGMSTSMMNSKYLNYFLTNMLNLGTSTGGHIRLWCGLWDAINDPLFGVIADKTRTKDGKFRPYIRWAPYVCAFFTMLFFLSGKLTAGGTAGLILTIAAFVGWDMSYTAVDIPIGALAFSITPNSVERTKLFGLSAIVRAVVGAIAGEFVAVALLFPYFEQNTYPAYIIAAAVSAAGMVFMTRPTYKHTRERALYSENTPSLMECLRLLGKNKPLILLFLANLIYIFATTPAAVSAYMAVDMFGGGKYNLIMDICTAPAPFVASFCVPYIAQKLGAKVDFKRIWVLCCVASAVCYGLMFVICGSSMSRAETPSQIPVVISVIFLTLYTLSLIPIESKNLVQKEMEAETVDFIEWHTGQRAEGIMISTMSFTGKLTNSAASSLTLFMLGLAKYQTHADAIYTAQSADARFALVALFTLVPCAALLLMLVPIYFYNITGEKHRQIAAELAERKAAAESGEQ